MTSASKMTIPERLDPAVCDWAGRISVDQIPCLLAFLTARLLAETLNRSAETNGVVERELQKLLTAKELADHLNVPESWVRTEERMGRIPGVRIGKYVRFKLAEVDLVLAGSNRPGR